MKRSGQFVSPTRARVYGAKARVLLMCLLLFSVAAHAWECKSPDLLSTINENFKQIGISSPSVLEDNLSVIRNQYCWQKVQWIGLRWEGPISGALLVFDSYGKLLSIERTGGIESVGFFGAPDGSPAVAVEEVWTGTGFYQIMHCIYSVVNGKILKLWEHLKVRGQLWSSKEEYRRLIRFHKFETCRRLTRWRWKGIRVDGVPKIYPSCGKDFRFHVQKLKTESYCWDGETI